MHFGLGVLKLPAQAFWAMSPRELLAAAGQGPAVRDGGLSRARLNALMAQFPDADMRDTA